MQKKILKDSNSSGEERKFEQTPSPVKVEEVKLELDSQTHQLNSSKEQKKPPVLIVSPESNAVRSQGSGEKLVECFSASHKRDDSLELVLSQKQASLKLDTSTGNKIPQITQESKHSPSVHLNVSSHSQTQPP